MKPYKLRSEYPCLIKFESEELLLDPNSEILFEKPETILVYPIEAVTKRNFPFSIDLGKTVNSRFFKCFDLADFKFFYICNPSYVKNQTIEKVSIGNINCQITIDEDEISFEAESIKKIFPLNESFKSYNIEKNGDFVFLKLVGSEEIIFLFNPKTTKLQYVQGNKIEKIENTIIVSKKIKDIFSHEVFETYEISNEELIIKTDKNKFYHSDEEIRNKNIIPYAFLETIKLKNFELSKSFLCNDLLNSTTNEHLENYFGKIDNIIPFENNLLGIISNNDLKIYKFELKDSLISEINIEK